MEAMFKRMLIIGHGMMGRSISLAASNAGIVETLFYKDKDWGDTNIVYDFVEKFFVDLTQTRSMIADELSGYDDINEVIRTCDLIIIATPIKATSDVLRQISPFLSDGALIMDIGSTKRQVLEESKKILGKRFCQFVGAHPIAGSEKSGSKNAKEDLFKGRNVILTPRPSTSIDMLALATKFWDALGCNVRLLSAKKHDRIFAAVSHVPHILSNAMMESISKSRTSKERDVCIDISGDGFKDFIRISNLNMKVWKDIFISNKDNILQEISHFKEELGHIERSIIRYS